MSDALTDLCEEIVEHFNCLQCGKKYYGFNEDLPPVFRCKKCGFGIPKHVVECMIERNRTTTPGGTPLSEIQTTSTPVEHDAKNWDKIQKTMLATDKAVRDNSEKLRVDLIPPEVGEILATVLGFGAKKYSARNWEKGGLKLVEDISASMERHLLKWKKGEDNDDESGLPHVYHILWNAMALAVYVERNIGEDDRCTK